jgi:hypothetical protein
VVGVVGGWVGVGGVVSPCVRTFQGLHSVRLWTPTIYYIRYKASREMDEYQERSLKILKKVA